MCGGTERRGVDWGGQSLDSALQCQHLSSESSAVVGRQSGVPGAWDDKNRGANHAGRLSLSLSLRGISTVFLWGKGSELRIGFGGLSPGLSGLGWLRCQWRRDSLDLEYIPSIQHNNTLPNLYMAPLPPTANREPITVEYQATVVPSENQLCAVHAPIHTRSLLVSKVKRRPCDPTAIGRYRRPRRRRFTFDTSRDLV
jgi:hypothetical protein